MVVATAFAALQARLLENCLLGSEAVDLKTTVGVRGNEPENEAALLGVPDVFEGCFDSSIGP